MDKKTVDRVINGHGLKEEAHDVVDWFSSSIEGQQCLSDMMDKDAYLIEDEMLKDYPISDIDSDRLFREIDKEIGGRQFRRTFMRMAAVLLPFIVIIGAFAYINTHFGYVFEKEDFAELYVPKGEDARLFFQDGTEVYLNSDTRIRYPKHFGLKSRDVYVDGEAYFKVKSNKRWPFKVYSQGTSVEVTGTSFNFNSYSSDETIDVVLDEGSTLFNANGKKYVMSPGQQIKFDKASGKAYLYNLAKPASMSLWKNNVLFFYDTPLEEVMKTLERKYNVKFYLSSKEALKFTYTLTTERGDLDSVLNELQKIAPVKFFSEKDSVFVSYN